MTNNLLFTINVSFPKNGFTENQIYALTQRVTQLSSHLQTHTKDYSSQRGLRKILGKRKRLLIYLLNTNPSKYDELIEQLAIRGLKLDL